MNTQITCSRSRGDALTSAEAQLAIGTGAIDRTAWDRARRNYECRRVLQDSVEKFGYLYRAQQDRQMAVYDTRHKFGSTHADRIDGAAKRELDATYDAEQAASDKWMNDYVYPTEAAAIALLITPAPDVEAVQFKMRVIEREDLHLTTATPRDCTDVLHEDIARIGGLN